MRWATLAVSVLVVTLIAWSVPTAANTTTQRCQARKQRAIGKFADMLLGCYRQAALAGAPYPDVECGTRARASLTATFLRSDSLGACPGAAAVLTLIASWTGGVERNIANTPPGTESGPCPAAKLKAGGRRFRGALREACRCLGQARNAARIITQQLHEFADDY